MTRAIGLGALVVVGGLAIVNAQPKREEPKVVTVEKVKDNLFVLRGGGDTAVLVMANGVAVVPTRQIRDGASPSSPKIKEKMTIGQGADQIDLYDFGRGRTNGDAWIVFPAHRIVHSGDIFSGKNVPLIDTNNGGSMLQIAETLKKAHQGIENVDQIINGHTPAQTTWATSRSTTSSTRTWSRGCGPDSRRARRRNSSPPSGRCPRSTRATRRPSARSWAAWRAASRCCKKEIQ